MTSVQLRAVRADDLELLSNPGPDTNPFGFFGFPATNFWQRQYAEDGLTGEGFGILIVESDHHQQPFAGYVGWSTVQYGPTVTARALNIGIHLYPQSRGQGIGSAAQDEFAQYLFDTTLYERLEAATDVDNIAEQKALARAGFTREGVIRHGQFRAAQWHDLVMFSRLRNDPSAIPASHRATRQDQTWSNK